MFLATTALSEFWDKDQEILFLGSWCLRYDRPLDFKRLHYKVLPYPWDQKERVEGAYKELQILHERFLQSLAEWLNQTHNLNRDVRYWRIIIGPWLQHFLAILKDRYTCLKDALALVSDVETIGLSSKCYVTPYTFEEFTYLSLDDAYNLQLMTQMLEVLGVPMKRRQLRQLQRLQSRPTGSLYQFIKKALLCYLPAYISARNPVQLYLFLPSRDRIRFIAASRFQYFPLAAVAEENQATPVMVDNDVRKSLSSLLSGDDFEVMVSRLLVQNLPSAYLEQLKVYLKKAERHCAPRVLASDTEYLHFNERFKVYAAEMVNRGTILVRIQHGAYGIYKRMPVEEHEVATCDRYWSWGWRATEKIQPLPAAKLANIKELQDSFASQSQQVLLVSTIYPRYLLRFGSIPLGPQFEEYFMWQRRFMCALPESLRTQIVWRPRPQDYGWAHVNRLRDQYPSLRLDNLGRPFQHSMLSSKLVVIDHNSTTMLEALAANKPSILFWDPARWEIRDTAIPVFTALREAQVLHETPESAAAHLAKVYSDPWSWWGSEAVQEARKKVVQNYANHDPAWAKTWCSALNELAEKPADR